MEFYPDDWRHTTEEIVGEPGRVFVLGAPDTGKTTFCKFLANIGVGSGLRVGIVDADVGQSHIGPPTTIGLGIARRGMETLEEAEVLRLHFVGSTSPYGSIGSMIEGTHSMVMEAMRRGLTPIIVDSTGLVKGRAALKLKSSKIDLISPRHIVALQKADELESLLDLRVVKDAIVHRLTVPAWVEPKSKSRRRSLRRKSWKEYLKGASLLSLDPDGLKIHPRDHVSNWIELVNVAVGIEERGGATRVGVLLEADREARTLCVLAPPCQRKEIVSLTIGSAKVDI